MCHAARVFCLQDSNFHLLTNNTLRWLLSFQEAFLVNGILRTVRECRKWKTRAFAAGASSSLCMFPSHRLLKKTWPLPATQATSICIFKIISDLSEVSGCNVCFLYQKYLFPYKTVNMIIWEAIICITKHLSLNSNVSFILDDLCHLSNNYLYWTTGVVLSKKSSSFEK